MGTDMEFGKTSLERLKTCHPDLQRVFLEVVKDFDCTVIEGFRGEKEQNAAFAKGASKLKFPHGSHNKFPSLAVDVCPYPVEFPLATDSVSIKTKKLGKFYLFSGFVLGTAKGLGISLRWGGDWDGDKDILENSFDDLVHFELRK